MGVKSDIDKPVLTCRKVAAPPGMYLPRRSIGKRVKSPELQDQTAFKCLPKTSIIEDTLPRLNGMAEIFYKKRR